MSGSDTIRIICIYSMACLLAGCSSSKLAFRETETLSPSFYTQALPDTCRDFGPAKRSNEDPAGRITVYKTSFREQQVETGSIINYASLNEASRREVVDYKPPRAGYRQDMFLVRVKTDCLSDIWFYYSVWYRMSRSATGLVPYGFGKAYLGYGHESAATIRFHTALSVKEGPSGFALAPAGKSQFYFVLDDLAADTLRVNRIVMEEQNKFGGPRSYVFKVADHFPGDLSRLTFRKGPTHRF